MSPSLAGMTQNQQEDQLDMFRMGKHRVIVATSVAEEGLDIQQCNIVVRCNYVSNEIGRVQAQGRNVSYALTHIPDGKLAGHSQNFADLFQIPRFLCILCIYMGAF